MWETEGCIVRETKGYRGWETEGCRGWETEKYIGWETERYRGWESEGYRGWETEGYRGWEGTSRAAASSRWRSSRVVERVVPSSSSAPRCACQCHPPSSDSSIFRILQRHPPSHTLRMRRRTEGGGGLVALFGTGARRCTIRNTYACVVAYRRDEVATHSGCRASGGGLEACKEPGDALLGS